MRKTLLSLAFVAGCYSPHPNIVGERTHQSTEQSAPTSQTSEHEAGQIAIDAALNFAQHPLGQPEGQHTGQPESEETSDFLASIPSAEARRREALEIARIYSLEQSLNGRLQIKARANLQERLNLPPEQRALTPQEIDETPYIALQAEITSTIERLAELYARNPARFNDEKNTRVEELERKINEYTGYGLSLVVIPAEREEPQEQSAPQAPTPLPNYQGREEREALMRLADLRRRREHCQSQYDSGRINQTNYESTCRALDASITEIERRLRD